MLNTKGFIHQHSSLLEYFYRFMDVAVVSCCYYVVKYISPFPLHIQDLFFVCSSAGVYYFFAEISGLYRSWRGAQLRQLYFHLVSAWLGTVLVVLFLIYISHSSDFYPRRVILSWFVLTPITLMFWRFGMEKFFISMRKHGRNLRRVAIVGVGDMGVSLAKIILNTPSIGLDMVGFFDDRKPIGFKPCNFEQKKSSLKQIDINISSVVVGTLDDLVKEAESGIIDYIYITLTMRDGQSIHQLVNRLSNTSAQVFIVPEIIVSELLHARWSNICGISVVKIFDSPFYGVSGLLKRMEDLIFGGIIFIIIAIPMIFIALGIKLTSPGPIIYKQRRYGLDGKEIIVWKFRTMNVCEDDDQFYQATKDDCRITALGAFLRRTSLDELPQFINVLQGKMSIIGPRPHPIALDEKHRRLIDGYMLRSRVKPGITGWAQVNGFRGETDTLEKMQKRVEFDLYYIRNWSLLLDLKIFFLTIIKIFDGQNAY